MVGGAENERKMREGGDEVRGLGWEAYGWTGTARTILGLLLGVALFPCHVP